MSGINPCFGCTKRATGCHGKKTTGEWRCQQYGDWKENREKQLAESAARIAAENDIKASLRVIKRRAKNA